MNGRNTILVVDDQTNVRNIMEFNLKRKGFDILSAQDGLAGITLAMNNRPDLIILDIMMPGIDGFQMLEKIRDDDRTNKIPVLIVSAKGTEEDILKAMKLGANDYIVKPFNLEQLMQKSFKLLQLSREQQKSIENEEAETAAVKFRWPVTASIVIGAKYPNNDDDDLNKQIVILSDTGINTILLDISSSEDISTLSFGKLAKTQQLLKKNKSVIKLITKKNEHLTTLQESNFAKHFEVYSDWNEALKEFGL